MATTGTNDKDTLTGGTGKVNDTLRGYLGDDTYTYRLGTGIDTVIDTGGVDTLLLGDPNGVYSGMDVYRSASGTDLVFDFGAAGKVVLQKQFSTTTTTPASRIEFLSFEDEPGSKMVIAKEFTGTSQNDLVVGKAAADSIVGGLGDDWIFGGAGNDTLSGGSGEDELHGGLGDDKLDGGLGNDYLVSGAGNDSLYGGEGHDEVSFLGQSAGIFVNMTGITQTFNAHKVASGKAYEKATNNIDTLIGIESVEGTGHADVVAFGQANTISNISVSLGRGNDTVTGSMGSSNSDGAINVGYWEDPNGVIVNLSDAAINVKQGAVFRTVAARSARDGWGDTDTFRFTDTQQIYIGDSDHDDYIRGRDNADPNSPWEWFQTGMGNDTIDGGAGKDTMNYSAYDDSDAGVIVNLSKAAITVGALSLQAGTARDNWGNIDTLLNIENVEGSDLSDRMVASDRGNHFRAGLGNDTLLGGAGNDFIDAGPGNDFIRSGAGRDAMYGGLGKDVFDFDKLSDLGSGGDADTIYDFVAGEDKIDLSTIDANPSLAGNQAFTFHGSMPTKFQPGQVWFSAGNQVCVNMDQDAVAEYAIFVPQYLGQRPLTALDFSL